MQVGNEGIKSDGLGVQETALVLEGNYDGTETSQKISVLFQFLKASNQSSWSGRECFW